MTVTVKFVNEMLVICAVQFPFGQPASCAVGCGGGCVVTLKLTVPFLIEDAGMASVPPSVTWAGFWPGAWVPPLLVQVAVGVPVAERLTVTSALPRPLSLPDTVNDNAVVLVETLWKVTAAIATAAVTPATRIAPVSSKSLCRIIPCLPSSPIVPDDERYVTPKVCARGAPPCPGAGLGYGSRHHLLSLRRSDARGVFGHRKTWRALLACISTYDATARPG
jgi:hypothetical protein